MTFAERVGAGRRTFARNGHLARVDVRQVVSEITGRVVGRVVEHGSGRVDAHARIERTVTVPGEQIFGTQTAARATVYEMLRAAGLSHHEAMIRMNRKDR